MPQRVNRAVPQIAALEEASPGPLEGFRRTPAAIRRHDGVR